MKYELIIRTENEKKNKRSREEGRINNPSILKDSKGEKAMKIA